VGTAVGDTVQASLATGLLAISKPAGPKYTA
jgi:hypothetical protein